MPAGSKVMRNGFKTNNTDCTIPICDVCALVPQIKKVCALWMRSYVLMFPLSLDAHLGGYCWNGTFWGRHNQVQESVQKRCKSLKVELSLATVNKDRGQLDELSCEDLLCTPHTPLASGIRCPLHTKHHVQAALAV
eukprot:5482283-Amphidinium_carterae.1